MSVNVERRKPYNGKIDATRDKHFRKQEDVQFSKDPVERRAGAACNGKDDPLIPAAPGLGLLAGHVAGSGGGSHVVRS